MSCICFRNTSVHYFLQCEISGLASFLKVYRTRKILSRSMFFVCLAGRSEFRRHDILGDTNLAIWCFLTGASLPGGARYVVF